MTVIYVKLLGEGTLVFKPVQAEHIRENTVKLCPVADYDSANEEWEFQPGTMVRCEERVLEGKKVLVAIAEEN